MSISTMSREYSSAPPFGAAQRDGRNRRIAVRIVVRLLARDAVVWSDDGRMRMMLPLTIEGRSACASLQSRGTVYGISALASWLGRQSPIRATMFGIR